MRVDNETFDLISRALDDDISMNEVVEKLDMTPAEMQKFLKAQNLEQDPISSELLQISHKHIDKKREWLNAIKAPSSLTEATSQVVACYVACNQASESDLLHLIKAVHSAFSSQFSNEEMSVKTHTTHQGTKKAPPFSKPYTNKYTKNRLQEQEYRYGQAG